jgi:ribose-phosphate pyrophosphokinase
VALDGAAEDLCVLGGRSHPGLTDAVCSALGIQPCAVESIKFPNDNTFVRIGENVRARDVFVLQTPSPPVDERVMELLILVDALRRASARRITAVLPYFPYARSDKKDEGRIPITARLVADLLETAGADRVVTLDLHSPQIQGFFHIPVDNLSAVGLVADHLRTLGLPDPVVVAPDVGRAALCRTYARRLGAGLALMDKQRTRSEVTFHGLIGDVRGRSAVLIDDEVDTAGSLEKATELLLAQGAARVAYGGVHAPLSGPAVQRLRALPLEAVVVTDTFPVPPEKRAPHMHVLSTAPLLAEAIRRIHDGRSLSAMFH